MALSAVSGTNRPPRQYRLAAEEGDYLTQLTVILGQAILAAVLTYLEFFLKTLTSTSYSFLLDGQDPENPFLSIL
jgi:hypothetical protein